VGKFAGAAWWYGLKAILFAASGTIGKAFLGVYLIDPGVALACPSPARSSRFLVTRGRHISGHIRPRCNNARCMPLIPADTANTFNNNAPALFQSSVTPMDVPLPLAPRRVHAFLASLFAGPVLAFIMLVLGGCSNGHSDALWQIVNGHCVPDEDEHGDPAPCVAVDHSNAAGHGWAVLKDRNGPYQYLLIPTARVTGIESELLYSTDAANYFQAAWKARSFVEQKVGHAIPREAMSLAINSRYARSQNQLHIHVDCLKADVRDALQRQKGSIGDTWSAFPEPLVGHRFQVRRIRGADLDAANPFLLLPDSIRQDESERGRHTLVLTGAHFAEGDGFILLDGRASLWPFDAGHGEDLQDHACP